MHIIYRLLIGVSLMLSVAGCQNLADRYAEATHDKSHEQWRSQHVGTPVFAGLILNAIPGFHLAGLAIDTAFVYSVIDDLILGNGAIIARLHNCPHLLADDDYDLFFAWQGGQSAQVMGAFAEVVDQKHRTMKASAELTATARTLVEKKVEKKLMAKLGSKIFAKVVGKAILGFVPFLGPIAAAIINWWILDGIDDDSRTYFQQKAKIVCI